MKRTLTLVFAATFLLFSGCKKETGPTGPQGPAGPALTGSLFGFIDLLDQYGNKQIAHNDSILVSLDGTGKTTYSDVNGKYRFDSLSTGVYNLTFSKAGYGNMRLLTQQFTGGGDVDRDTKMSAIPNFSVSALNVTVDTANVILSGSLSQSDTRLRTSVVFLGTGPASSDPSNYALLYSKQTTNGNLNGFTIKIPLSDLQNAGFASGTTLYFAAYGASASFVSSSFYEDFSTGRNYFNALSSNASTASVVLP
jgi:hypothetical protein